MVATTLLLLALQQPQLDATVSRTSVEVGDTLSLEITLVSSGGGWLRLEDPALQGLEVIGSRQISNVTVVNGAEERRTRRILYLRAVESGEALIGPAVARRGAEVLRTREIRVAVEGTGTVASSTENPIVQTILAGAPPPGADTTVTVALLTSDDTVTVGEQLDLVVVAWFPRTLRSRLRNPPTLEPPQVQGAWTYRQNSPNTVVTSTVRDGEWYDMFIHHQTIFPLSTDGFDLGQATVTYNLPLSFSFLSRELRHVVQSEPRELVVLPQPATGRPDDFRGAAGSDLALEVRLDTNAVSAGTGVGLSITLSGEGNVSLWPEPEVVLPVGVRSYPRGVTVSLAPTDGIVAGTKSFEYLVVPDSIGTHRVRVRRYDYFDVESGRYRRVLGEERDLVATEPAAIASSRPAPPPLLDSEPLAVNGLFERVPLPFWIAALLLPGLIPLVRLARRPREAAVAGGPLLRSLHHIEIQLGRAISQVAPSAARTEGEELEEALVAAGVDASLAAHTARLRSRLSRAVYGPDEITDSDELEAEAEEVLRALGVEGGALRRLELIGAALLLFSSATPALAQSTAAELYRAGAYSAAAERFAGEVESRPSAAAWYNLAASRFQAGEISAARVAALLAARRAPRAAEPRRLLELTGESDGGILTWVAPLTPEEIALIALALWISGWSLLFLRRRRVGLVLVAAAVLAAGVVIWVERIYSIPAGFVAADGVPLRKAPHGLADPVRELSRGQAVRIERSRGGWLLVSRRGESGWIQAEEVSRT